MGKENHAFQTGMEISKENMLALALLLEKLVFEFNRFP